MVPSDVKDFDLLSGVHRTQRNHLVQNSQANRMPHHLLSSRLDSIAHPLVFGGRAGQSSGFRAVLARSFVRYARQAGVSASIVLCDLASAYYEVVRELLVGSENHSPSLQEICTDLGLSDDDLQAMAHMAAEEPIFEGQDEFMQRVVQEAGHFALFLMAQIRRGTRPGGLIADLLFRILFVCTLKRRQMQDNPEHIPSFKWDGLRQLVPPPSPRSELPCLEVKDIVYADDLSICSLGRQQKTSERLPVTRQAGLLTRFLGAGSS